ncbi:MAG: GNAT family N-acetyltransferase [Pseudomonadota bacterium]
MKVRRATIDDATAIAEFNIAMALETENKTLDSETINSGVKRVFSNDSLGFYLVAEIDGAVAGCLMITYEWSDWRDGLFWWIQSVYVAREFRCRGVFKALYRKVESLAREDSSNCGIRLYVEKDNVHAQNTYSSLGMTQTDYRMFEALF